eukprot:GHUV01004862.1.p1 GENE.GHUV01004862.1~~GHUV01004862.1.p1  ORF type:complete len:247 (+),score=84.30 GHUV01004862.1:366-1106(+)
MAECSIASVDVLNNPAAFTDPIILEVQYTCLSSLREDLEWKIIYVGSAESDDCDQVLDSALVGPVNPGQFKFRMEAPAPDPSRIPQDDLLGVTALLLTCSYKGTEFVRVGYYVNIEYTDPELAEAEIKPNPPIISKLQRSIMADHPRVTRFPHDFDKEPEALPEGEAEPEPDDGLLLDDEEGDDEGEEYEEDYDEEDDELLDGPEEVNIDDEVENVNPDGMMITPNKGQQQQSQPQDMETDGMQIG